ncbi:MAG: hypothetical protein NTY55_02910 [Flavobacteriia bacterium]|nr:hypothetical protein [Flavobacteriia bacterium]
MSKLKTNFATRVVTRTTPKYDGAGAGNGERMKIYAETNAPETKVILDKSIYAKTAEDRLKVSTAKVEWIRSGNSAKWLAQWGKPSVKKSLKN